VVTRRDYNAEAVQATQSVLLEVLHALGEYAADIVLVGGWVPSLIANSEIDPHIGTTDVDLALDHRHIADTAYENIRELLLKRGYKEGRQPFIFIRTMTRRDTEYKVEVDLLAGEYGGTGKKHRTQRVQDARPRKARGCDLVFDACTEVTVEGELPGGGRDRATVKVASIMPFLVMKGMALASRLKEKDAYDIYYCLSNYPGGPDAVAEQIEPALSHGLVREGLLKIREKFSSPEDIGPVLVADFLEETDPETRDLLQRDAYERVGRLIENLGLAHARQ